MTDLFDTARVPDDDAYWDALASRVAALAARNQSANGFDWLARTRAGWLAASILLAAALGFILLPAKPVPARTDVEWAQVLAPADDVGRAMTRRDQPPAIGALLLDARWER